MGRSAKLEMLRRLLPLCIAVLGTAGGLTFLSPISAILCLVAAIGIYTALPYPKVPKGAVRPNTLSSILITDFFGFAIGLGCMSGVVLGTSQGGGVAVFSLLLLLPAISCVFFFLASVKLQTSWTRFLNNGFEVCQYGRVARLRYDELRAMRIREVKVNGTMAWLASILGLAGGRDVSLVSSDGASKTLVFVTNSGIELAVASETIPDLQRVLIGMDRAGVSLPEGISRRQRDRIRKTRERLYRKREEESDVEQLDQERIAEAVRKFHAQRAVRDK